MTTAGKQKKVQRFGFEAATVHPFTITGAATVSYDSEGSLVILCDTTDDQAYGIIPSVPYQIENLIAVEFLFWLTASALDPNFDAVLGIASVANADPDAIGVSAWARLAGATAAVSLESDDGTTDVTGSTGETTPLGSWNRLRLDFSQLTQTISPPGTSKGHQMSAHLTNDLGFNRRLDINSWLDLDAAKTTQVSPYFMADIDGTMTVATTMKIQEICVEYVAPY